MNRHLQLKRTVLGYQNRQAGGCCRCHLACFNISHRAERIIWTNYSGNNAVTYYIVAFTNTFIYNRLDKVQIWSKYLNKACFLNCIQRQLDKISSSNSMLSFIQLQQNVAFIFHSAVSLTDSLPLLPIFSLVLYLF